MTKISLSFILVYLISTISFGQVKSVDELDQTYLNWYNKDVQLDNIVGVSINKVYDSILTRKEVKKTVIVAVLDSGIEIDHDELKGQIWINEDEIPGNNIDDDNNGYIDDIHGWNFLGNSSWENISYENFEYTRIIKDPANNGPMYEKATKLYDAEYTKRKNEKDKLVKFEESFLLAKSIIKDNTGIEIVTKDDLKKINTTDAQVINAKKYLGNLYSKGFTEESLEKIKGFNSKRLDYYLNKEFNPRELVGDDPSDFQDRIYGNPDVAGPNPAHGTSVAGIIAGIRDNDIGINGIAANAKIMVLRTTPDGDERDKDVALGIIYAVDNGADIINMSFGKEVTPQKEFVDEAVKYAEKNNVLIVHGSGNYGRDLDANESFPSDRYVDGSEATNFINVGATAMNLDKYMVGKFSNYGRKHVDIFAPGVKIISLDSSNTYSLHDGTSVSAPVVSGVAALILSYYPDLKPAELIDLMMATSYKFKKPKKVYVPNLEDVKRAKAKFTTLSKSGGIVNAYEAFLELENSESTKTALKTEN